MKKTIEQFLRGPWPIFTCGMGVGLFFAFVADITREPKEQGQVPAQSSASQQLQASVTTLEQGVKRKDELIRDEIIPALRESRALILKQREDYVTLYNNYMFVIGGESRLAR